MEITEIIIALAIAMIEPYFFHTLVNKVTGYSTVEKMCDNVSILGSDSMIKYEECHKALNEKLGKIEWNKHLILLTIALVSIVMAVMIKNKSTKLGLGIGGLILIFIAMTAYWRKYTDTHKIIVLGISFIFVVYLSLRVYTTKSFVDIFSVN